MASVLAGSHSTDFSLFLVFLGAEAFFVFIGMKTTWIGAGVASGFGSFCIPGGENKQNRPWYSLDIGPTSWNDIKASDACVYRALARSGL